MSEKNKIIIDNVKYDAESIKRIAEDMTRQAAPLKDGELNRKIQKITEGASEVVKHIQERTEK